MSTSKSKSKEEQQQLPPSGRMNDLLGNYRALQEVLSSLSIESARALHAIGNDISLQQKIRERQYDIPIYIYIRLMMIQYQIVYIINVKVLEI
jgi:hypothetical protein